MKRRRSDSDTDMASAPTGKTSKTISTINNQPCRPLPPRTVRQLLAPKPRGNLTTFKGSKELFTVGSDVVNAICQLNEKTGILHGDISPAHIMVNQDGSGTLVDWDIPGREKEIRTRR